MQVAKTAVALNSTEPHRIPLNVYQTWVNDEFGRTHARSLTFLRGFNPDCSFRLFSDVEAEEFMRLNWANHPIFDVYSEALFGPMKMDIWRYCKLFVDGGIYLDINKAIDVPLSRIFPADAAAVISYDLRSQWQSSPPYALSHQGKAVSNWLIGAEARHQLFATVLDLIVEDYPLYKGKVFENPKSQILNFTGPHQLSRAVARLLESGDDSIVQLSPDFDGHAIWELPGSWVRYAVRNPYSTKRFAAII